MENKMKKNYQKPEIIEEIELDRKVVYASGEVENPCEKNPDLCD